MNIRKITEKEMIEYHRLSQYAFGEWKDKEPEKDKIIWMNPEHCLVVTENGKMISGMINHHLKQSVRGIAKKLSGIGNVATYPEFRNKGCIKKLFAYVFNDCRKDKLPVSMLQPFKSVFYQKFGYVPTSRELMLKFDVNGLLHYLKNERDTDWQIERSNSKSIRQKFIRFISREALKYNGMVIYDEFYHGWQEHLFKDDLILLVKYKGKVKAACRYVKKDMKIRINDARWENLAARKVFFSYFATHRDQIGEFIMPVPLGVNFFNWFQDCHDPFDTKICEEPWMVRIIDLCEAFAGIKTGNTCKLTFKVTDEMCAWNNGCFELCNKNGQAVMKPSVIKDTDFDADIRGMTALLYGTMPIDEIVDRNWLMVNNKEKLEILGTSLPEVNFFNSFWF